MKDTEMEMTRQEIVQPVAHLADGRRVACSG